MIWSTHAVAGGVTATVLSANPALALTGALISHFVLDAIPHWDYKLKSIYSNKKAGEIGLKFKFDKDFFYDCFKISLDLFLGLVLVWFLVATVHLQPWLIMAGAVLAMVPDWLLGLHGLWPNRFLKQFVKFHNFFHHPIQAEEVLTSKPIFQLTLIFMMVWFF